MFAALGTVCGQGVTQSLGRLRALTVSAVVSQVVADIREGIVGPGQLQGREGGAGAHGLWQGRGQGRGGRGVLPVGGIQLPVESGLGPVSQMRDPGLFVGQGVDELQRLGSFLLKGRRGREWRKKKKGEINSDEGAEVELGVTTRWWCNTGEEGISPGKAALSIHPSQAASQGPRFGGRV